MINTKVNNTKVKSNHRSQPNHLSIDAGGDLSNRLQPADSRMIRNCIEKSLRDPDRLALHFIYVADRKVSIRIVSPFRWQERDRFLGLCLANEDARSFRLDRIYQIQVVPAANVLMPCPVRECRI